MLPPKNADDPEGVRCWRDDDVPAPYSRHYSPDTFAGRIAAQLPAGLAARVVYTPNLDELMEAYPAQRIYPFFTLVLEHDAA